METRRWLVKQEPEAYAWEAFVRDGRTAWTGVRNFQARNFLRAMRTGDLNHAATGVVIDALRSSQRTDRHAMGPGARKRLDLAKTEIQDRRRAAESLRTKARQRPAGARTDHRHDIGTGSCADLPHKPRVRRPALRRKIAADFQPIGV